MHNDDVKYASQYSLALVNARRDCGTIEITTGNMRGKWAAAVAIYILGFEGSVTQVQKKPWP